MEDLEGEDYQDSEDEEQQQEQHSKLLSSVSQLDSTQRVKAATRKEISSQVSEYNLTQGSSKVNVKELAQVLGSKTQHGLISKKVDKVAGKCKTLPKPLEKPVEERIKRSMGFSKVKNQLKRWDAIVARNSLKDRVIFPLSNTSMKMQKSHEFLNQFKSTTPLELEISQILNEGKEDEKEDAEDKTFPLTLEEMLEKRKEMAQLRAKLSYKEAKAQRQSKIKSKKYHRILRREKLRQQLKEFELLQKTDPEAALKKLTELDKSRAQERASLRHRNTGLWAKNMKVRAKYDIESRKVLAEQLKTSREITQKIKSVDSSDDENHFEFSEPVELQKTNIDKDNPWSIKVSKEMENFVSGYKKYWEEQNKNLVKNEDNENQTKQNEVTQVNQNDVVQTNSEKEKSDSKVKNKRSKKVKRERVKRDKVSEKQTSVSIQPTSGVWIVSPVVDETEPESKKRKVDDIDTLFDELNDRLLKSAEKNVKKIKSKLKREQKREEKKMKKTTKNDEVDLKLNIRKQVERPDMDVELLEGNQNGELENLHSGEGLSSAPLSANNNNNDNNNNNNPAEVDPKNFIQVKAKKLMTSLPDAVSNGDEALDDGDAQLMAIEEAFGDDDIGTEFKKLKKEENKEKNVNGIVESSLPGWGSWGGADIKNNVRKKRRLILNLPKKKGKKKSDTIINENENPKLREHLVKEVPHPFKSVEAFEANIRVPVGRDWMPETAHRALIQKQVVTKMGAVIEPMDEEELIRQKKKAVSPYKGKKKLKKT